MCSSVYYNFYPIVRFVYLPALSHERIFSRSQFATAKGCCSAYAPTSGLASAVSRGDIRTHPGA